MNALVQFSSHPLAHQLIHTMGWTLLHFCWQGTLTAAVLWCVLALPAARSSQARYGAACLALMLLVAMPLLTFARIASADYKLRTESWNSAVPIDPAMIFQFGFGEPVAPWPVRIAVTLDHWMPWLLALWFTGAIFFAMRLNFGLLVARKLKSEGTEMPPTELQQMFDGLRLRLRITRVVTLLHSARVQVPTVIGWMRPVVLIPASCLTGLSTEQIEAIFCHELAHVRRHDYMVSVFQSVAESLLFYHPAVWWVSKVVRRERECCCDEIAVSHGGDVLAYAKALSFMEEQRAEFPEFVLGANGGVLTMRIKRLLGRKQEASASPFAALTLLAVVLAIAGSYVATVARAQPKASPAAVASVIAPVHAISLGQAQAAPSSPQDQEQTLHGVYKVWVNQDVAYIITPEERAAFLQLTDDEDEERDKFIHDFWERRNPTPGSVENTFKEEHYARIAYSNQHFAENQPGWSTDRGRVYIVLGKPNEIDFHPRGDSSTNTPYEVWRYRATSGTGQLVEMRFVDTGGNGNYRLAGPGPLPQGVAPRPDSPPPPPTTEPPRQPMVPPGLMEAQSIYKVKPIYPEIAKAAHVQGVVALDAHITAAGTVDNLRAAGGPTILWASAMDAARQWTYKPFLMNGQPTEVETTIQISYRLNDDGTTTIGAPAELPLRVASGVLAGMLISNVNPVYPAKAKIDHVQGTVVLHAIITKEGTVGNLAVVSGPPQLTASALDAVKQWRYRPYLLNGQPTEVEATIMVNFTLGDSATPTQQDGPLGNAEAAPKMRDGATAPKVVYQVEPEFSEAERKAKISGTVLVNLKVDEKGMPRDVHVLRGLGNGLDKKAVEAVKQYRFKPAMKDDKPVEETLNIEVNFQIF